MKWFRLILAAALSLICIGLGGAPTGDLRFVHYNRADGSLPYDGIRVMMQDSRRMVWIGTHKGLSMYDGVRFQNYYRDDFRVDSDYICSLHEDIWGNLWIGTDSGVVLRTPEDGKFHPMAEIFGTTVGDRVFSIISAPDSTVWFGTRSSGLYRCRPDRKELRRIYLQDESGDEVKNFYRLSCASDGTLFTVVYCSNIYTVVLEDSCLSPIATGDDADFFINDDIEGLVHGRGGEIYVASKKRGLCRVNPGGKVEVIMQLSEGHRPVNLELCGTELFLSTTEGLFIYDTASAETHFLNNAHEDPLSIADNYVCSAFRNAEGAIWVGTLGAGVNHSSPAHGLFSKYSRTDDGLSLAGCNVSGFAQDASGGVWVATEKSGLLYLSGDGQLRQFRSRHLPQNMTAAIGVPPHVWIGAQNGIYRFTPPNGRIVAYPLSDSPDILPDNRIVSFYRTNSEDHTLYAATSLGVLRYDSASDSFLPVPELDGLTIEGMAEDGEGRIWMASYSDGVYVYDPKNLSIEHYSSRSSAIPEMISSLCVDAKGRVWVASFSSGIFVKEAEDSEFRRISRAELPALPTDMFFCVVPDNEGNLYLSSDGGLVRYCPETSRVKLFRVSDGLLENQFRKSSLMLSNGRIILGSANGFVDFDPAAVKDIAAPVVISGSSAEDRQLHFCFAVPSIPLSQSGGVCCMLEGYERNWRDVSTSMEVTYRGVPAGQYYLRVGSMDADGVICESEGMYIGVPRRHVFIWLLAGILMLGILALLYFRFKIFRKPKAVPVGDMDLSSLEINDYDNDFIQRLEKVIMENIQDPDFSPSNLEKLLFISHSTLNRKMKSLFDTTPGEYIRKKRLSIAAHLLSTGSIRVSEIVRAVGFSSASYFTKCFKAEYGMLPVEYREQHSDSQ